MGEVLAPTPPVPEAAGQTAPPPVVPQIAREELDVKVRELIALQGGHPDDDLIEDIIQTALRLMRDGAPRGELKVLAAALRELRYAFKTFRPYANVRKVTVFGSARTPPDAPEYKQAHAFSEEMARRGYMVITGAGPGIMEAAQGGAGRENSFGVNIRLPFEQSANPVIDGDKKLIQFRYFFTRKLCFVKEASGIALFPGGFGTHDEGFEALTLIQTGKSAPIPVVFVDKPGGSYWREWADYVAEHLLGNKLIGEEDMNLFKITDDAQWAADEIANFYKRYHSSRYVRDKLVLRMLTPLPEGMVDKINAEFGSLLVPGSPPIAQTAALPMESDQPELASLPRLVLTFNRRNFGKLRRLIDAINNA
ncbi:MAG: LOG family protein [Planctomycetes bacterium]|nr:LOG family protein [Planctomycetota bacterium]